MERNQRIIIKDPRYRAVDAGGRREEFFREYIRTLDSSSSSADAGSSSKGEMRMEMALK